jgi:hypothetical protein
VETKIRKLITDAARREGVDVIGSAPYVEQDNAKMIMYIRWMGTIALFGGTPLDIQLDYHLDKEKRSLIWVTLEILKAQNWVERNGKGITLGHCACWTQFAPEDWH